MVGPLHPSVKRTQTERDQEEYRKADWEAGMAMGECEEEREWRWNQHGYTKK
jgi:hypothetical protein